MILFTEFLLLRCASGWAARWWRMWRRRRCWGRRGSRRATAPSRRPSLRPRSTWTDPWPPACLSTASGRESFWSKVTIIRILNKTKENFAEVLEQMDFGLACSSCSVVMMVKLLSVTTQEVFNLHPDTSKSSTSYSSHAMLPTCQCITLHTLKLFCCCTIVHVRVPWNCSAIGKILETVLLYYYWSNQATQCLHKMYSANIFIQKILPPFFAITSSFHNHPDLPWILESWSWQCGTYTGQHVLKTFDWSNTWLGGIE